MEKLLPRLFFVIRWYMQCLHKPVSMMVPPDVIPVTDVPAGIYCLFLEFVTIFSYVSSIPVLVWATPIYENFNRVRLDP